MYVKTRQVTPVRTRTSTPFFTCKKPPSSLPPPISPDHREKKINHFISPGHLINYVHLNPVSQDLTAQDPGCHDLQTAPCTQLVPGSPANFRPLPLPRT